MEALVIPTGDLVVTTVQVRALAVLKAAEVLAVVSEETKALAVSSASEIARVKKTAEERRVEIVKPHNDYVNGVNALFKRVLAPLLRADDLLRGKVLGFIANQRLIAEASAAEAEWIRREAEKQAREAARAAAAGDTGAALALVEEAAATEERATEVQAQAILPVKTVTTTEGKASTRKTWTFSVKDFADVPRAYLCLDEVLVREAIKQGVRNIDGLRIYEAESLTVQAARREPW